jgi:hypothetical protein
VLKCVQQNTSPLVWQWLLKKKWSKGQQSLRKAGLIRGLSYGMSDSCHMIFLMNIKERDWYTGCFYSTCYRAKDRVHFWYLVIDDSPVLWSRFQKSKWVSVSVKRAQFTPPSSCIPPLLCKAEEKTERELKYFTCYNKLSDISNGLCSKWFWF